MPGPVLVPDPLAPRPEIVYHVLRGVFPPSAVPEPSLCLDGRNHVCLLEVYL